MERSPGGILVSGFAGGGGRGGLVSGNVAGVGAGAGAGAGGASLELEAVDL